MIATQEFVVPRSIPMTGPVFFEENEAVKEVLNRVRIIIRYSEINFMSKSGIIYL